MSGNQPTGEKNGYCKENSQDLKTLVLSEENESPEKELISLRGIGKALVSEKKLDEAIKEAKKSLFHGVEDVVRD